MRIFFITLILIFPSTLPAVNDLQDRYQKEAEQLRPFLKAEDLLTIAQELEAAAETENAFPAIEKAMKIWSKLYFQESLPEEVREIAKAHHAYAERQFVSYCEQPSALQPRWLANTCLGLGTALKGNE